MKIEAKIRLQSAASNDEKVAKHNKAVGRSKSYTDTLKKIDDKHPDVLTKAPKGYRFDVAHKLHKIDASNENPLEDGVAFDTLVDGDPSTDEPEVQKVTHDDGGIEKADPDQELLMDDIAN